MWVSSLLYIVAGALLVYVIWSILRARKATVDQALALLGVVVAVIIALSTGKAPVTPPPAIPTPIPTPATSMQPAEAGTPARGSTLAATATAAGTPTHLAVGPATLTPVGVAPATIPPTRMAASSVSPSTTPSPIKEYGMPRSGGRYLVFDTALRVVYGDRLVKLDIIEDEDRFKASSESIPWEGGSIAWDQERRQLRRPRLGWKLAVGGISGSEYGVSHRPGGMHGDT